MQTEAEDTELTSSVKEGANDPEPTVSVNTDASGTGLINSGKAVKGIRNDPILFNFKLRLALNDAEYRMKVNSHVQVTNAQVAAMQALEADANSVLKSLIRTPLVLATVEEV